MSSEATVAAPSTNAAQEKLDTREVHISLTAKDVEQSIAWYRDVLGFAVEYPMERDGKVFAASMRSGAARLIINQDDGNRGWTRVKGEGFAITFDTTQDVDAVAAGIKARGGTLLIEPADMPWGVRMFRVVDPDGYRISISKPLSK